MCRHFEPRSLFRLRSIVLTHSSRMGTENALRARRIRVRLPEWDEGDIGQRGHDRGHDRVGGVKMGRSR